MWSDRQKQPWFFPFFYVLLRVKKKHPNRDSADYFAVATCHSNFVNMDHTFVDRWTG